MAYARWDYDLALSLVGGAPAPTLHELDLVDQYAIGDPIFRARILAEGIEILFRGR